MPRKVKARPQLGGMRGMKNRQLGREGRTDGSTAPSEHETSGMPDPDEEVEDPIEHGMLVDQGDGTRVLRRGPRKSPEDRDSHECPDEPPKGWGDG